MLLNVNELVDYYLPDMRSRPRFRNRFVAWLEKVVHQDTLNQLISKYRDLKPEQFLDKVIEYVDLNSQFKNTHIPVPETGRVLLVSNHPMGALDGLGLLQKIRELRSDTRIVVNHVLWHIKPLQQFFLPLDTIREKNYKTQYKNITHALEEERPVIIFPAGNVSRLSWRGIRDDVWKPGFLKMAKRTNTPILPLHVTGHNSFKYYTISLFSKWYGMLYLVDEMMKNTSATMQIRFGQLQNDIDQFRNDLNDHQLAQKIRQSIYQLKRTMK